MKNTLPAAVLLAALSLLGPAAAGAAAGGPYYFTAVQCGAYNFKGGEAQLEESYKALQGMVKLADAQGVRLTLLLSAQYALYISTAPARQAELEAWKKTGHEVGAYHQGPETRAWDGYSDLGAEELGRLRKEDRAGLAAPGRQDYFAALGGLEPALKTGCMLGGEDKSFLAAAPGYEICGSQGRKGINKFLAVPGEKKAGKNLSSFHAGDKAGVEAAEKAFSGMTGGVYGALFKGSPSEFGAFYTWLAFLRGKDPEGLRSRTVSLVIEGGLLPKKEPASVPAAKQAEKETPPEQASAQRQQIPRLKPVPSNYGRVGSLPPLGEKGGPRGYCGDGTCDAFERVRPGLCRRDCGK